MENQMNNEPEVITEARRTGTLSVGAILAEYDRVCAERGAAVRERDEVFTNPALLQLYRDEVVQLRTRLAACERVVEAACEYVCGEDANNVPLKYAVRAYRAAVSTAKEDA